MLLNGIPRSVMSATEQVMDAGVEVIGPECAVPLQVKNENLIAIAQTVKGTLNS